MYLYRSTKLRAKVHYPHPKLPHYPLCQSTSPSTRLVETSQIPEGRQLCGVCEDLKFRGEVKPLRSDIDPKGGSRPNKNLLMHKFRKAEQRRLGLDLTPSIRTAAREIAAARGDVVDLRTKPQARKYLCSLMQSAPKAPQRASQSRPQSLEMDVNSPDFLSSYEWRTIRMKVLTTYEAKCMCCNATREDGVKLHVDHIKPRRKYPELALAFENLQILCEACNHGKGNWDETDWRPKRVSH